MVAIAGAGTDRASATAARRAAALAARTSERGASNGNAGLRRATTVVGAAGGAVGLTASVAGVAHRVRCDGGEAASGNHFAGGFCCDADFTG